MRRIRILAVAIITAATFLVPSAASAATMRLSDAVAGMTWECASHTYTVTGGTFETVMHVVDDPEEPTGHISLRASNVTAVDETGAVYRIVGSATSNVHMHDGVFAITDTVSFQIVGRGRTDSLNGVFLVRGGRTLERAHGSCGFPG